MPKTYQLDQTFIYSTTTHEFRIHWTRVGDISLPPIVFIHGTPWSNVVWHDLTSTLSSRYSIYLFDHPGFGSSPVPRRLKSTGSEDDHTDLDPSLNLRAVASAALLKSWDLKRSPHVVAHDNGGLVSARLLLRHGVEFSSLCLIDVVALGRSGLPFFKLVAENESIFTAIPTHLMEGFIRGYVRSATFLPMWQGVEDALAVPWLHGGNQGPDRFLREMIQAHHRDVDDIVDQYRDIGARTPVKIIWGRDDAWIPVETAQKLRDALNAREVVIVEEAGHLIHYDQPSKLALELGLWLSRHGADES